MGKKKRYYRTASLLGAQPQMVSRARPRRLLSIRVPWFVWLLMFLSLAAGLWLWRDTRWYMDVSQIHVLGASKSTKPLIVEKSDILGVHSLWVRADQIAERVVSQIAAVTEAKVECWYYPARCTIQVKERQPVLAWATDTITFWVDETGYVFPARVEEDKLPMVRGPLPPDEHVSLEIIEGVKELVELGVPQDGLTYHPDRGLTWSDAEGRRIAFGTGADMATRWRIYQALIEDLDARGIFPWTVDVRFPAAPTYSLERTW